jgi:DNA-binding transcriptional regulator YiaG
MPDVAAALKAEITRLARKETKQQVAPVKKTVAEQRRTIAELRRQVAGLTREQALLRQEEAKRTSQAAQAGATQRVRYSPKWVKADRKRLGLSARDYGRLVGVSAATIYGWEEGKSKPRAAALTGWANVRGIGKREAARRLAPVVE